LKRTQSKQNNKFWNFIAASEEKPAELILYGDISESSWWGDEITPRQFSEDLIALGDVEEIVVRLNSGGGDVFAANAIYTRLKDHKAKITVKIDGWAASAATIVAMAGDVIEIPGNGVFMVHEAKMGLLGYYGRQDFEKMAEEITVINNSIVNGYALKTGKDPEEIAEIMKEETWYTGEEAVGAGFCDKLMFEEVETEVKNASRVIVNSVSINLDRYNNAPQSLQSLTNHRPAHNGDGFSNNQQKTTIKEGVSMEIKTKDELRAAYPALVAEIESDAIAAERQRIKDVEEVAMPGFESIVNSAKFDTPKTAAEVAVEIINKQKKLGTEYLNGRNADVKDSKIAEVGAEGNEGIEGSADDPFDAAVEKLFPEKK